MKRLIAAVLIVAAVAVSAQDMRTNNRGILFTFNGLSDLGLGGYSAQSGSAGIGAKMFNKAGNMAIRPMLVFSTGSQKDVPADEDFVGEKTSSTAYGILVDGIKHLNKAAISPFIGVGAGFGKSSDKTESAHADADDPNVTENSTTAFTVRGLLGVEVFIKKNISLSGEYRLSYGTSTTTASYTPAGADDTTESKVKHSNLGISAAGVLTLAIYVN
jgi:opacity protein-like surface antigen